MSEYKLLQPATNEDSLNVLEKEGITLPETKHIYSIPQNSEGNSKITTIENHNHRAINSVVNEMSQPPEIDNILSHIDQECRFASYLTTSSKNVTHEVSQGASQNLSNSNEYRHLGCTNNATYGMESSSSESELFPCPAEAAVDLELELLSLVAELSQARLIEARYCQTCCQDTCLKRARNWDACQDLAKNHLSNACVNHIQKEDATLRSAKQNQRARNQDQKRQHTESCDDTRITPTTAVCSVSRRPRLPEINGNVELKQSHLFADGHPNISCNFTNLSAKHTDKALLIKEKPCQVHYRESMNSYIPAKYWERQKLTTVFSDQDMPLCPTRENYWETAARDPISNPFQLASDENQMCWQQSSDNTSGCNNIACENSVHLWNKSNVNRLQHGGNYVNNRKNETGIHASVSNAPMAANYSEIHPCLGTPLNDAEKKINKEQIKFKKCITTRLASSDNKERQLQSECSGGEKKLLDGKYQIQDRRPLLTECPQQRAGSIYLSLNQQKGNDGVYGHLLDTSKYIRRNESQEGKSQLSLSSSKTFPTGNFNEIIQKSNGSLALFPSDGRLKYHCNKFSNYRKIKSPKYRRLMQAADTKETSPCHTKPTNSKNQLSFDSLSMCANSTDNRDMQQSHLSYPQWYTRMQSTMQRTRNSPENINDDNKGSRYQRVKHSRRCRRRRGVDGAACCNMCLPGMSLNVHTLFGDNNIGKRNSRQNHMHSRGNNSQYLTQRSANNMLRRTCGRGMNTKLRQSGRRRRQYSRSTSTNFRHCRRRSIYSGDRGKCRRSTPTSWRRRNRRPTYPGLGHHNYKPGATSLRHGMRRSTNTSQVNRHRRSKNTGHQSGSRRTRETR